MMDADYKYLAVKYAEKEGERLRAQSGSYAPGTPFEVSKGFDARVYAMVRQEKLKRVYYALSAAAACVLIALIGFGAIPAFTSRSGGRAPNSDSSLVAEGAAGGGSAGMANEGALDAAAEAPATGGIAETTTVSPAEATTDSPAEATTDGRYEPITLQFNLPPHLSVADVKQDKGQTVFYIDNAEMDDIVLVTERSEQIGGDSRFDEAALLGRGLRPISINDTTLYAVARADYSYATFQSEGVIYQASCKHDFRTLISLCEYIL